MPDTALRTQIVDRLGRMSAPEAYELSMEMVSRLARTLGALSRNLHAEHPVRLCAKGLMTRLRSLADEAERRPVEAQDLIRIIVLVANEVWRISAFQTNPWLHYRLTQLARLFCERPRSLMVRSTLCVVGSGMGKKLAPIVIDA